MAIKLSYSKPISVQSMGSTSRLSNYRVVDFPDGSHSATARDYKNSGYDRGHLVPAGDFMWNQELKNQTFVYTNISPFNANLNRGIWANLEHQIRTKAIAYNSEAYVITGALFLGIDGLGIGPNRLEVPTHYYKIAYYPERQEVYAFLFDNKVEAYWGDLSSFQVTVDFIERISKLDFFDRIQPPCQDDLESRLRVFEND